MNTSSIVQFPTGFWMSILPLALIYLGWLATAAFFEYIPFFGDSSLQFFLRLPILQVNR